MEHAKLNEFEYWNMINKIGWYCLTQDVCNGKLQPYEAIKECANILVNEFNLDEIEIGYFKNFVVEKRLELSKRLTSWIKEKNLNIMDLDDMWDLSSHIVGMGETMYYFIWDNPRIMYSAKKGLIGDENFEFIFDEAIYNFNLINENE